MKIKALTALLLLSLLAFSLSAQTEDAYNTEGSGSGGLLDPNRLKINHSISFGAAGSNVNSIKSQSLYSTMLEYKFVQPVTVNLNFGFPIHSTFSSASNLNAENIQSTDYFRNMPVNFSLTWNPNENFLMRFSVIREPQPHNHGLLSPHYSDFMFSKW
ncbi:MAG: hypothetical protein GF401_03450 [Chitinivibrionales bacterium]|nr:hypothetical protein [Chitinivibrionales bacterium]